jgi:hypothetical protein
MPGSATAISVSADRKEVLNSRIEFIMLIENKLVVKKISKGRECERVAY